jgi:hypothetical protein
MSYFLRRLCLIAIVMSLTACTTIGNDLFRTEAKMKYSHLSSDMKVSWNTVKSGNDLIIDGFITNLQSLPVVEFNLAVVVLDTNGGKRLSEGTTLLNDVNLKMKDSASFRVKFKNATIVEGDVLEFNISYGINAGSWIPQERQSSFKVDAITGIEIGKNSIK